MAPDLDADRRQLAAHLALHSPTHGPAIRAALAWDRLRFWDASSGAGVEWFVLRADGWGLTDRGRADGLLPA